MLRYIYIYIYIAKVDDSRYSWGWGNKTKKITSIWVKEKAYSNKQYNVYIYILYIIYYIITLITYIIIIIMGNNTWTTMIYRSKLSLSLSLYI